MEYKCHEEWESDSEGYDSVHHDLSTIVFYPDVRMLILIFTNENIHCTFCKIS